MTSSPKCPRCESTSGKFFPTKIEDNGLAFPLMAVACCKCGCIIGILPLDELRKIQKEFSERLAHIEEKLGLQTIKNDK